MQSWSDIPCLLFIIGFRLVQEAMVAASAADSSRKKRVLSLSSDEEDGDFGNAEAASVRTAGSSAKTQDHKSKKRPSRDSAVKFGQHSSSVSYSNGNGLSKHFAPNSGLDYDQPSAIEIDENIAKMYGLSYDGGTWDDKIDRIETMEQTASGRINVYFYLKQKEFAILPVESAHRFFPKVCVLFSPYILDNSSLCLIFTFQS
jgi:hypothetical protein